LKIVIAGYGAVGKAVHYALEHHPMFHSGYIGSQNVEKMKRMEHSIWVDDPNELKYDGRTYHNVDTDVIGDVDGVIVCVATPMRENGSCNTDHVQEVFNKYGATKYLIKSAVDPVWLRNWVYDNRVHSVLTEHEYVSYTYSPEFLGGSNSNRDATEEFQEQTFAIYGGDDCRWWDELLRPCLKNLKDVKYCSLEQAAFAKYVENCFLATKVTFFNEMYRIFNDCGFEGFLQMVDAITLDPRIGRSHTQVPGPDGLFGYGGHCFPKDMAAMRFIANQSPLLDTVVDMNEGYRNGEKD